MKASFKLPENNIKASFSIPAGGGGTYDYERLRNKPSINEVELIGNKTSEELGLASIEDIPTLQDLVTPEQLEALNSGATSTNIAQISTNAGNIILIDNTVSDLSSTVQSNYTILDNKIDTTQTTLQGNINALSGTVTSNYNDLTQSITNNVSTLNTRITNEVSTLNGSITNEATTRQNADNNLQSQIDAITSASDVFDIVGTYAELQAYNISNVPVNDIIKVLVDSTHNNSATYYRCIETAGIKSWSYIGSEGAYYTKSEADGLFVEQTTTINNKPLSNNITLNASDVGALPSDTQIGNGTITLTQGGVTKGTFTLNQTGNATIDFDAGGSTITVDSVLSTSSTNPVQNKVITVELNKKIESITSSDVTTALGYTPQTLLVSGTNIKTINNESILGSGNINIQSGGTVDQTFNGTSANAQSGVAIAGELVNYMPLNSSSDIDIYANSINFDLSDKLTLNSAPVLCQGWNSLSDNVDGFGINIDTDGLWYSWNYNYNFYVDYESSSMYGYEYGSNNTVNHKHGITVNGNGISFSNLNYETAITIPSDGSLALNGHNIITDNNLKTINNQSIIGSGNINISGGTTYTEGNGIDITNDTISIDTSVVATQTDISDMATQTWVGNQGYLTSSALTNYVTTDTAQDISGRKTFLGEKAIYFKQNATTDKLGFTLYNPSNTELGALEYRPNTISGASLLALNCPQTTGGYVGFRYWGSPAVNIVAPKVATAGSYYIPINFTNGTNTVTSNNVGTVNIRTLIPTIATSVSSSSTNAQTVGAKLFYDTVGNIETLLSNV